MSTTADKYWRTTTGTWGIAAFACLAIAYMFFDAIRHMVDWWSTRAEYSHGFLIPAISIYLIWQRSDRLKQTVFKGSWYGVGFLLFGLGLYFLGELSTIYSVVQYGFVIVLIGLVWAYVGTAAMKIMAVPLFLLFFMVPFPNFIYNNLSSQLQLLSSQIGVAVIRLFDISVFLEGNVIDLGSYKLQVVEACNGLRYLFPLMTLGFIVAYLFHASLWKRTVLFLSTLPITILMNSFRIGVIGVMVEYWGQSMAEGFLHDFEGWVIFMACFGILFLEMWVLMRLTNDRRPLREVFGIDPPVPSVAGATAVPRDVPIAFYAAVLVLCASLVPALTVPDRTEKLPDRREFSTFPLDVGGWRGRPEKLEQIYLDALKLTDYALINYSAGSGEAINFYSAYYDSQRKGQSAHSPRSCIPGGGWRIESLTRVNIPGGAPEGRDLNVNRVIISAGEHKQIVYYWFQQRGRFITNEFLVKWFVFWDALTRNRSDGALVRLTMAIGPNGNVPRLEETLQTFVHELRDVLPAYIPR